MCPAKRFHLAIKWKWRNDHTQSQTNISCIITCLSIFSLAFDVFFICSERHRIRLTREREHCLKRPGVKVVSSSSTSQCVVVFKLKSLLLDSCYVWMLCPCPFSSLLLMMTHAINMKSTWFSFFLSLNYLMKRFLAKTRGRGWKFWSLVIIIIELKALSQQKEMHLLFFGLTLMKNQRNSSWTLIQSWF